jgi:prepilin-type N-terminal cleavage/methylation domain-containing protein/prepilin-type processing-associated H-X9-DG protein
MKRTLAFTLIELLVVVAIIGVLAGLALPVYNKVAEKGRVTKDASNLRQVGIATLAYVNDNDEAMFSAANTPSWPNELKTRHLQSFQVFLSPFDKRAASEDSNSAPISYGFNNQLFDTSMSKYTNTTALVMMAPAPNSTDDLVFAGQASQNVSISQPVDASKKYGTHADRNQLNVLFADFHIENVRWNKYATEGDTLTWKPFESAEP